MYTDDSWQEKNVTENVTAATHRCIYVVVFILKVTALYYHR